MNRKPLVMIALALALAVAAGIGAAFLTNEPAKSRPRAYVGFPAAIDPNCRDGKARAGMGTVSRPTRRPSRDREAYRVYRVSCR